MSKNVYGGVPCSGRRASHDLPFMVYPGQPELEGELYELAYSVAVQSWLNAWAAGLAAVAALLTAVSALIRTRWD